MRLSLLFREESKSIIVPYSKYLLVICIGSGSYNKYTVMFVTMNTALVWLFRNNLKWLQNLD